MTIDSNAGNVESGNLEKQLRIKRLEVSSLLEVTQAINNNLGIDKLFRIYEFILRAQIGVKKLAVFVRNEQLECACSWGTDESLPLDAVVGKLSQWKALSLIEEDPKHPISHFDLIMPIHHKDEPIAYALLDMPEMDAYESFEEKISFIQTITNIIIVAVENKRLFRKQLEQERFKKELELAAQVQSLLIASDLPDNEELEMYGTYLPNRDIGGDYYDYFQTDDFTICCIADVSGKGAAAAMVMANFQAILRTLVQDHDHDLAQMIVALNERVRQITKGEKFITFFIAVLDRKTRTLYYVNAGHNPPVLWRHNKAEMLEKGTTILGIFEQLPEIHVGEVPLKNDEAVLLLYTDGLTDVSNDKSEFFNANKLIDFIKVHHHYPMKEFHERLLDAIDQFKGDQSYIDDISMLSCRFRFAS